MGSLATSSGSTPKRRRAERSAVLAAACAAIALAATTPSSAAEPELLPNERAFAFSARGLDERTVEARFEIADGYYLYREKLRFAMAPGSLESVTLPAGDIKDDEFFGKQETYRRSLVVRLPLAAAAPGRTVTVDAESQGCADIGVCYPPQRQKVTIALPLAGGRPGPTVEAAPKKASWFN